MPTVSLSLTGSAGPNGYGKTSLLEAILLALTRHYYVDSQGKSGVASCDSPRKLFSYGRADFAIRLEVAGGPNEIAVSGHWPEGHTDPFSPLFLPKPWPRSVVDAASEDSSLDLDNTELDARLCGFFQDRVDALFDETTSGRTLRDIFERPPATLTVANQRLEEYQSKGLVQLQGALDTERNRFPNEERAAIQEGLTAAWRRVRHLYLALREGSEAWRAEEFTPPDTREAARLREFILKIEGMSPATGRAAQRFLARLRVSLEREHAFRGKLNTHFGKVNTRFGKLNT